MRFLGIDPVAGWVSPSPKRPARAARSHTHRRSDADRSAASRRIVRIRSAREMHAEVLSRADAPNNLMPSSWRQQSLTTVRPVATNSKIEKGGPLTITLERTPDILADLGTRRRGSRPVLVGFAAQTGDPVPAAGRKLAAKQVDLIVANDVSAPGAGFDTDTNIVTLVDARGQERLPLMSKRDVAAAILDRIEAVFHTDATPAPASSPAS